MKKVDLTIVDEIFLEDYISSIDIDTIKSKLGKLKFDYLSYFIENLGEIITADIEKIEKDYLSLLIGKSSEDLKKIENVFNYKGHRKKEKFMESFKKLGIKSCPFCNNNYVYFYKDKSRKYNTIATLEHYYPKAQYPHLSLCFYNLIPSCSICNSKFKGNALHVGNIIHPYRDDFNAKATFSLHVDQLAVKKSIKLKVKLTSNDDRCKKTIDRFQLDKVYEEHHDIAKEIWNKAQVYNEGRMEELYKSFYKSLGYTKEEVKNFVFCNYLHVKDINKRNHSKLTQDILKQLDIF